MKNTSEMKITVFGIGGVGGAISAKLLKKYGAQVTLIARGKRKEHFEKEGLTLHGDFLGDFTVPVPHVTDDPSTLPKQDILLICVKNDALDTAMEMVRPLLTEETIVVPIMNGVTAYRRLKDTLPCGVVLPSVIYTVSMATEDFSVVQKGNYTHLFVGPLSPEDEEKARLFHQVMTDADIDCRYSDKVLTEIWNKFILNCAYNVATARFACPTGEIKYDEKRRAEYRTLMEEAYAVGLAEGVSLSDTLLDKLMKRFNATTDDSDSSLSRDFAEHKIGELEVFCGDVIRMAEKHGIDVPMTREYYRALLDIAAGW
ncbi:MAG: 2-dehydropantoate 2-reductase [Lachnospiraceae bacterium]|nr:2-dehydropantoate 2-reductase [Lachnospiraceae bacterium]